MRLGMEGIGEAGTVRIDEPRSGEARQAAEKAEAEQRAYLLVINQAGYMSDETKWDIELLAPALEQYRTTIERRFLASLKDDPEVVEKVALACAWHQHVAEWGEDPDIDVEWVWRNTSGRNKEFQRERARAALAALVTEGAGSE